MSCEERCDGTKYQRKTEGQDEGDNDRDRAAFLGRV